MLERPRQMGNNINVNNLDGINFALVLTYPPQLFAHRIQKNDASFHSLAIVKDSG